MKKIIAIVLPFFIFQTGCRLGPKYHPPKVETPQEWKASYEEPASVPEVDYWWEIFEDGKLDELEGIAVANNPTIELAIQKVIEARAMAQVAGASLYPQITLNPSYTDLGELFQVFIPGNIIPGLPTSIPPFRIHQMQYFLPLTMNYELDLWGRLRSQYESAVYMSQASYFDYQTSLLTLTTDLASDYFQLRALDSQIVSLAKTLDLRQVELNLAQSRYDKGLVTYLDVASAETQLENVRQQLLDFQRQRVLLENMIATLLGMPSSEFCIESNPLANPPPVIPSGMPASILLRRPDLAEAERNVAAEQVLIGAAYASFFPTLSINGTLGYNSPEIKDFLKWKSRYWEVGANSTEDVFDGGRDLGNLRAAWARFREASASYQQNVLTAFQEVENALSNVDYQAKEGAALERAVSAGRISANLSLLRYRRGLVTYIEVVQNDQIELQAEINLAANLGYRYVSTVQLIKALGGGWDVLSEEDSKICQLPQES